MGLGLGVACDPSGGAREGLALEVRLRVRVRP